LGKYRRRGTLPWLRRAFLKCTHTDVQAYPAPPYMPIPPDHGISDESGTLVLEKPVTGVPGAGLPLARPSNSTPPKSTARLLPASGISNGDFSNNAHSFTRVDTASNFSRALILPGTSHTPPPVESRGKREPLDRPHQYQKSRKKGEVESLHWSRRPLTFVKLLFLFLDSRVMIAAQNIHSDRALIDIT
jgi:hypothetical protein